MTDGQKNEWGQPIGEALPGWTTRLRPGREELVGNYCALRPLVAERDAPVLFELLGGEEQRHLWTYLPYGPFSDLEMYKEFLREKSLSDDPLFFSIIDGVNAKAVGVASYLRIEPAVGVIEVGHLCFSSQLSQTRAATEAMYLMMKHVFEDLGYRRYEWKCDALNAPSRSAALRLGFRFEGIFRQATVYKGRSRDTAWFSVIDSEWPTLRSALEGWLQPENFDAAGGQKRPLGSFIA